MNKYLKSFLLRGLIFGGFGPIICSFVFLILNYTITGLEIFIAFISTYMLAFIHAGTSVFHQIESFSPMKSALLQLGLLYAIYIFTYLINAWLPIDIKIILIFTIIFIVTYLIIWLIVYFSTKTITNKLNKKIK